ncbi:hypothetical protein BKA64DRAFT_699711 [Cadophora sp. MPI-SDFR-AT-0126]|nr:hypothetical protein BKA64DRAFT_699711 [Leotiomycetes sp. MPI-SDFR-AT-0126]
MAVNASTCPDNAAFILPGRSTACGVTVAKNNTAILTECCESNPVVLYGPARALLCNLYCNMTTATYEESPVFKYLDSAANLTGCACKDERKKSAASSIKRFHRLVLAGVVGMIGVCVMGSC